MRIKGFIIVLLFVFAATGLYGQQQLILYGYDGAGNRIGRVAAAAVCDTIPVCSRHNMLEQQVAGLCAVKSGEKQASSISVPELLRMPSAVSCSPCREYAFVMMSDKYRITLTGFTYETEL